MEDMARIGSELRRLREEARLSRKEVADRCKISVSALAMYEGGFRIPRDTIKQKLADVYGVSVESIFFTHEVHET